MSYKCIKSDLFWYSAITNKWTASKKDGYKKMMKTDGAWEAEVGGQPQA